MQARRLILPTREIIRPKREPLQVYGIRNGRIERGRLVLEHRARSRLPAPYIIRAPREMMAVAHDADSSSATDSGTGQTSATHGNLTVGSSLSNGALLFIAVFDTQTVSNVALHWDSAGTNQAMTLIGSQVSTGAHGFAFLFGLLAPTSGNKTLNCTWTTAAEVSLFGCSWTGVDQTSVAVAFPHFNSAVGSSTAPSVTITSATGNAVVGAFSHQDPLSSVNNTQLYIDNGPSNFNCAGNRAAGAASVAMSAVDGASAGWAAIGVDILAAGAGGDVLMAQGCM